MPQENPETIKRAAIAGAVFLDTEFTSLARPKLLSIGLCAADGHECYVELDPCAAAGRAAAARASAFAREMVLPQLGGAPTCQPDLPAIGRVVADWLAGLGATCLIYDFPADLRLLREALRAAGRDAGPGWQLQAIDMAHVIDEPEAVAAAEASWRESERDGLWRHHALADARALRAMVLETAVGRAQFDRLVRAGA